VEIQFIERAFYRRTGGFSEKLPSPSFLGKLVLKFSEASRIAKAKLI
jgi:hypothetical protein